MTIRDLLLGGACVLVLGAPRPASAQNFLMNSAETINRGNFKIAAFPTVILAEDDAEDAWGVATRLGYGFTDRFDVEAKVAFFDGLNMYGADAEYWLVKGDLDVSVSGGLRFADYAGDADTKALDLAGIASLDLADKLEAYLGGSLSFESVDTDDSSFQRFYLVPGIEYRVARDLDLLAEVGIGLADESPHYVSFGLAYYIR